jgi:hypothetical protein
MKNSAGKKVKTDLVSGYISDQIFREIRQIRYRLDDIEKTLSNSRPIPLKISSSELSSSDLTGLHRAVKSSPMNMDKKDLEDLEEEVRPIDALKLSYLLERIKSIE